MSDQAINTEKTFQYKASLYLCNCDCAADSCPGAATSSLWLMLLCSSNIAPMEKSFKSSEL